MRENFKSALQTSATRTVLFFRDRVSRAAGRRAGALFFARHLDYFIVCPDSQSLPGLGTV